MCTSFVFRKNSNIIIGMNFDNNGMPFSIKKDSSKFIVYVNGFPSFGVNSRGDFINNLMVDSNGKGIYKRLSSKVMHTAKLTDDIFSGKISSVDIKKYLSNVEYVNPPNLSVHNMIVDKKGNTAIVEPGRGIIYSSAEENPFVIMTNFSLCDYQNSGELKGCGADRYQKIEQLLKDKDDLTIEKAFEALDQVKQSSGEWTTVLSLVYSSLENAVYYYQNSDLATLQKYKFQ